MSHIILDEIREHPDLAHYTFEQLPLLKQLLKKYYQCHTNVCIERAKNITDYMKSPGQFQ